jgi:hypothetical protein
LLAAVSILIVGCKSNRKYDLIEAELRTRERELAQTRSERDRLRLLTETYERGLVAPPPGWNGPSFHQTGGILIQTLSIGSGTGGVDNDGHVGDESLMVVVVPKDEDGTAMKVPARLTVQAFEVTKDGLKHPIGKWEVGAEQLRRTWRSGLLSSGYFVPLMWDKPPSVPNVKLQARLTTPEGKEFEAEKDITVKPLAGMMPARNPSELPPPAVQFK